MKAPDPMYIIAIISLLAGTATLVAFELWNKRVWLEAYDRLLDKLGLVPVERVDSLLRELQELGSALAAERAWRRDECNRLSYELANAKVYATSVDAANDELRDRNSHLAQRILDGEEITAVMWPKDKAEAAEWEAQRLQAEARRRKEQS